MPIDRCRRDGFESQPTGSEIFSRHGRKQPRLNSVRRVSLFVLHHRVEAGLVVGKKLKRCICCVPMEVSCKYQPFLVRVSSGAQLRHFVRRSRRRYGDGREELSRDGDG